jgi:pimeloyl-ACP methyl ester carboxylesterase
VTEVSLIETAYTEIDGAGHLPQIDRPADFDRVLLVHLRRVVR